MYLTLPFWLFVLVTLGIYSLLSSGRQNLLLLVASYLIYLYLEPQFVLLLAFATGVTYLIGQRTIHDALHTRRWFTIGVAFNIAILAVFKYRGFFLGTIAAALNRLGFTIAPSILSLILPLGISFYTFRLLSYLFYMNNKRIKGNVTFVDMALYVAFFPQIVAGPIERGATFIPALREKRQVTNRQLFDGLAYIAVGLFYKIVLADPLVHLTDANFAAVSSLTALDALKTIILYSIRLYGDFAGYSAMAIGISLWFGLPARENFRQPYFSRGIIEFWTRWHISLSSWFRDYFFFPLSRALISRFGSRQSFWIQVGAMLLTMTLTGLWHGPNLTFLVWGLLHGVYMAAERLISRYVPSNTNLKRFRVVGLGSVLVTQILVMIGWVIFRAPSLGDAVSFFQRFFVQSGNMSPLWWLELAVPLLLMIIMDGLQSMIVKPSGYWNLAMTWRTTMFSLFFVALLTILGFAIIAVLFFGGSTTSGFVYQNF